MTSGIEPVVWNDWYVIGLARELKPQTPLRTRLLGLDLEAEPSPAGPLVWVLDGARRRARQAAAQERYGFVWACLGTPEREPPSVPEYAEPGRRFIPWGAIGVPTSGLRVIENFLDLAHFSFVHTGSLGDESATEVAPYKVEIRHDPDEVWATSCKFYQPKAAAASSGGTMVDYTYRVPRPFAAILYKSCPVRTDAMDLIGLFVQPVEPESSRAHPWALVYDDTESDTAILHFQHMIFGQDRPILINQIPRLLPLGPRKEMPTRADATSVIFRRWLGQLGLAYGTDRMGEGSHATPADFAS